MGAVVPPEPALLLVGMLYSLADAEQQALALLERRYGPVTWRSPVVPWTHSRYYADELGEPILRRWITLGDPVDPERLAEIKLETNALERDVAGDDDRRRANLDPGLLSLSNLVLASTKPCAHRVAIGRGICAEVTLLYRKGRFEPLPWTYPDYAAAAAWFAEPRTLLKQLLRGAGDSPR